jgi:TetR/AcrR family transcriptional regulator
VANTKRRREARSPVRSRLDGDTEQRILRAAHRVFVRRGTDGARLQEIADEAHVNKALLHYYFRTKDRLAAAVFQRVVRQELPRVFEILASDLTIEEKVRQAVTQLLDRLSQAPYAPGYILSELSRHPERVHQFVEAILGVEARGVVPGLRRTLGHQIAERVRQGTMRDVTVEQFAINLQSLCLFPFVARPMLCAVLQLDDEGFARFVAERKRTLPDFFLAALRP